ncbi:transcription antitermination factor NusB [Dysgonomonas sp. GY617]|uniref:transcription antitermination factor NusB n=1 Tax=Dysgonomonas sp. GY617 TaxID=2780420 RepID=UPI00188479DF|nr:transcription antitermination factor NusB [Dysgonomonas sp. GY617]MBF0575429.1 transcription antitermination factor NusB [Dysgonomonas sp. GY617]
MINRVLIRIRVIQVLYSTYLNESGDLKKAETELMFSLQKSYDLYYYLLALLIEITDTHTRRLESRKAKLLPTDEDINPNTRLSDNLFIKQLKNNEQFNKYVSDRPQSWEDHENYVRSLLEKILNSDIYAEYLANEVSDYDTDREFWRKVFKTFIYCEEQLDDLLEDDSLFWNDDIEIVQSFVIKTIKKFDPEKGANQPLLPMFKDEEDRQFAIKLLRETMFNVKLAREYIDKYAKNWESERIAFMDMIIMQTAVSELIAFPSVPINVTMNEYINIAKSYSTHKSSSFINGILDSIVTELKSENKLLKK